MPYGTRFSVAVLLLLLAEHARTVSNSCALYSDAAHVRCLRGAEVLRTVTGSSEAWMLEFYSGWCGHCQRFAPTLSSLAEDMRSKEAIPCLCAIKHTRMVVVGWSSVMRVGVVECTLAENRDVCTKTFGVQAFPTLKVSASQPTLSAVCDSLPPPPSALVLQPWRDASGASGQHSSGRETEGRGGEDDTQPHHGRS